MVHSVVERVDEIDLDAIAREIRGTIVGMSHTGKAPHLGSSLSCVDILVAAYWTCLNVDPADPKWAGRDFLIFSKGHAAAALYATLAHRGYFPMSDLDGYNQVGAMLSEHPPPDGVDGVELATGSLGHGLPVSVGIALANRLEGSSQKVVTVLSDGECNEGSVWEAAMFGASNGLQNLCVVVDANAWQATGRSSEVMALEPLADKWAAFGWAVHDVDGHNIWALSEALASVPGREGKPTAIIARTVKGKGVSFMEDDNNWHYRIPTEDEVGMAREELGLP